MAYMELHQEFRDHTKVKRLAGYLSICRPESRSMIVCLWTWAIGEARSGDLSKFTAEDIADACHAEEVFKDPNSKTGTKVLKALVEAHIVDQNGDKIVLHDWKDHGVRILEQSRRRVAKSRRLNALGERTVTLQTRDAAALLSLFLSSLSNQSIYPSLRSERFAGAWQEWTQFRKEKRKPLSERQALKQLAWLASQQEPIGCIDQSIRNGWQGLFELKVDGGQRTRPTTSSPGARVTFSGPNKGPAAEKEPDRWCEDCQRNHKAFEMCPKIVAEAS